MTTITVHDKEEDRDIVMMAVDARHAIAADPERYSEVSRAPVARKSGDLESRLSAIEARLDVLEALLEEHDPPPELIDERPNNDWPKDSTVRGDLE